MSERYPWWMTPGSMIAAAALGALAVTWRIRRLRFDEREAGFVNGRACIHAFWHARLLPLVYSHRHRSVAVLTSQHRDGEIIARVLERFGFRSARGSSRRGGDRGLREMLAHAGEGRSLAITPDGPRGPAERVKPGIVYLASRTGFPVLPVASAASSDWRLNSWDGFRVPRPFARVVIAHGEPITVPPDVEESDVDMWCRTLEAAIGDVTREADALAREGR
jgi:lysophospholipid acyltransferase (LPLAT)-like uncharacterized protein